MASNECSEKQPEKIYPGSDTRFEEVFDFAYIADEDSVDFLNKHGRVLFIIRGLPGTGKSTLASVIFSKYASAIKCSADDYFSEPFVSNMRDKESLRSSHAYCLEKVSNACKNNQHPIVVQNTHVRKWEMQPYIDLAHKYCYIIIMAITTRRIALTSEVLEKTNTQGLSKGYFQRRIRQWEEVVPQYTGWFLNPADAAFILKQTEISLGSIQEEKFTKMFCASSGDPADYFSWENHLFCIAAYCNVRYGNEGKKYYLSNEVQLAYGKNFKLTILGFFISKSLILAVVQLKDYMEDLVAKIHDEPPSANSLSNTLSELEISASGTSRLSCKDMSLHSEETTLLADWVDDEAICINSCSFIVLASSKHNSPPWPFVKNIPDLRKSIFSEVTDSDGNINVNLFTNLENGTSFCKLADDKWFILSFKKITVDSAFTGLYN